MVSIIDVTPSDYNIAEGRGEEKEYIESEGYESEDFEVPQEELDKIRLLLKG